MGQRSGAGLVELAILEALDVRRGCQAGGRSRAGRSWPRSKTSPGWPGGMPTRCSSTWLPWQIPVPLAGPQGNFGGRGNDPPASPHYTEARLSPAGQIALTTVRGQIAPVPLGLINASTHRQGTRPPFRPAAVIDAIRQVLARPRLPARQITAVRGWRHERGFMSCSRLRAGLALGLVSRPPGASSCQPCGREHVQRCR